MNYFIRYAYDIVSVLLTSWVDTLKHSAQQQCCVTNNDVSQLSEGTFVSRNNFFYILFPSADNLAKQGTAAAD